MRQKTGRVTALIITGIIGTVPAIACGPTTEDTTAVTVVKPSSPSRLQVVNNSGQDMEIYMVQGNQSVRLGVAAGNRTTEFPLNGVQLAGGGPARFEARQMSNSGVVVNSQPNASGTQIILQIPPS